MLLTIVYTSCFFFTMTTASFILVPPTDYLKTSELVLSRGDIKKIDTLSDIVEEPCSTRIIPSSRPKFGHIHNGSRVEIRQDDVSSFTATFVECLKPSSASDFKGCHGIDRSVYASQCITIYEHRPAMVRLVGTYSEYYEADIRVPVHCECRLRKFVP